MSVAGARSFLQSHCQKSQRIGCTRRIGQHGTLRISINHQPSHNRPEKKWVPSSITSQWPGMWPVKVQTLIMGKHSNVLTVPKHHGQLCGSHASRLWGPSFKLWPGDQLSWLPSLSLSVDKCWYSSSHYATTVLFHILFNPLCTNHPVFHAMHSDLVLTH